MVILPPGTTFPQFLELAASKLGVPAKRVFNKGSEVDDVNAIRDDDELVITSGENLPAPGSKSQHVLKLAVIGPGGVGKSGRALTYPSFAHLSRLLHSSSVFSSHSGNGEICPRSIPGGL